MTPFPWWLLPPLVIFALAVGVAVSASGQAAAPAPASAQSVAPAPADGTAVEVRIQQDRQLRYLTSGAWHASQGWVFFDAIGNRLTRLAPALGGSLEAWRLAAFEDDFEPFPQETQVARIQALPNAGDLLAQHNTSDGTGWSVVRLAPSGEWTIQHTWTCPSCSANQWVALYPELLLAAGEIQGEDPKEWRKGLYWITPEGPSLVHELAEEDLPAYMMGLTWLARLDGRAYAIVPEPGDPHSPDAPRYLEVVELSAQQRGVRRLARLPAPVPDVPYPRAEADSVREAFGRLAQHAVPLALVGAGDHLVVVLREGEGVQLWTIDPATGGLHFVEGLSEASAATVAVGEDHLALIRKGPIEGVGRQPLQGLLLYPLDRLTDRTIR